MVMHPFLFIAGGVLDLAGFVGLGLTHFGIVAGFLIVSPILFAAGITVWLVGAGMPPIASAFVMLALAVLLLLAIYWNWLGLGTVL